MDRADLSAAIIAGAGETVMTLLGEALPSLLTADLASLERQVQALSRVLWGHVVEEIIGVRTAVADKDVVACQACGDPMRRVDGARERQVQGLIGEYTLRRAYYHCAACGRGHAPLDAQLGLGTGALSPELLLQAHRAC